MANEEHLAILKQGVDIWNRWRRDKRVKPDLIRADLTGLNLSKAKLAGADLVSANLAGIDLTQSDLRGANFLGADLSWAHLLAADARNTNLMGANLTGTNLLGTDLTDAKLIRANLTQADLGRTDLRNADLSRAKLVRADFKYAICGYTVFSDVDLSTVKGLDTIQHINPSTISIDTLIMSGNKISLVFLEGCGVPKMFRENLSYVVDIPAIQYHSCFISYSTKDEEFTQQLNDRMKRDGLRVWFAPEEMKAGKKIHEQLYEAIRYHDKLILVLSKESMKSDWVQLEIKRARKHERDEKRRKLFPISLVPYEEIKKWELITSDGEDLAEEINLYFIPDFSQWKDYDKFNAAFDRLLGDLRADE